MSSGTAFLTLQEGIGPRWNRGADAPSAPPRSGERFGGSGAPRQARPAPRITRGREHSGLCAGKAKPLPPGAPRGGGVSAASRRQAAPAPLRHGGIPGLCSRPHQAVRWG